MSGGGCFVALISLVILCHVCGVCSVDVARSGRREDPGTYFKREVTYYVARTRCFLPPLCVAGVRRDAVGVAALPLSPSTLFFLSKIRAAAGVSS